MDKTVKTVLNIASKQTNLGFGFVALLTAGGEQIFSTAVFKCPCNDWNFFYGMVFLLVPALALLVLGYILSKKTWKLFTGLCVRKSKFSKICRLHTIIAVMIMFFQITTTAVVAPFTWIAVALLNGNYFECAFTGVNVTVYKDHLCGRTVSQSQCQEELYKFPCKEKKITNPADKDDVLATLRAESQIVGWLVIASLIVCNLILTCVARCKSPISYLQLKFWRTYAQEENALLESLSAKHAKELAERNLKSFFEQKAPVPITSPSNQDWQKISRFYRFNPNDHYYSTLHQYVESDKRETDFLSPEHGMGSIILRSLQSDGPSPDNPAVLYFLDEAKMPL